ncbi:hypothetical protein GCM10009733_103670 [Nonomuraea maheshkhaliensis]|uniref:Uncharacterized protein n=1 Tax=Nonomuraea maheshkhaliensis TaxID=419590 RepID=A0ABN2HNC7_9ACTN
MSSGRANDEISGGRTAVVTTGNVIAHIRTHNSSGTVVYQAQGSHAIVTMVHREIRSARSSCKWGYVLPIPGTAQMYCHWRSA